MANKEQLNILLKEGVQAWNEWREENQGMHPNLSDADLSHADLSHANLNHVNLTESLQLHFVGETQP